MATKNVQSKMKDINEDMNSFGSSAHSSSPPDGSVDSSQSKTTASKGDYIDFEEIK